LSLRSKFLLYLTVIHLLVAAIAAVFLKSNYIWLLISETLIAASYFTGRKLMLEYFRPIELIRSGAQLLNESDFKTRFLEVGQPDMDQLVHIYNRMVDNLREERTRLQEHHYLMESILKVAPSGIITLDFNGRIAMVNPVAEKMLQSMSDDLLGRNLSDLQSHFGSALADLSVSGSKVIPLWGGRRVKCQRVEFMDRGFRKSFIVMEELTEELRQTEKAAYEKLIRIMSHEVNNSTGAVNSLLHSCLHYADQIRKGDREDFETAIGVMVNRTNQLNSFMSSFAEVVRLPPPKPAPCDLKDLLEELVFLMREESAKRRITWNWVVEKDPEQIALDRIQMEQVFVNLFKNSLEALDDGGSITISISRMDGRDCVSIEDTGRGMTPEVQSNLFVPFFSTKPNGQGIGLTLVQEILSQHHFDFTIESSPGGPTRFSIFF
jgi:two-component system, NtrC family, nitrogen regulation sensor histidine kinase NtrY